MTLHSALSALSFTQADASQPGGPLAGLVQMLPFGLMFLVLYFLLVRPASKQRKEHQELLSSLKKDDEVVTSGGIWGRIIALEDKIATLEIADKVKIKILRDRIAGRWSPDTITAAATQK